MYPLYHIQQNHVAASFKIQKQQYNNNQYAASHQQSREGQVIVKEYPSGHMPYIGEESGAQLAEDLRAFISKEEMESCF